MEMTLASGNPGTLLVTVTLARRRVLLTASTVGSTLSVDARVYVRDTRRYVSGYIGCRHGCRFTTYQDSSTVLEYYIFGINISQVSPINRHGHQIRRRFSFYLWREPLVFIKPI